MVGYSPKVMPKGGFSDKFDVCPDSPASSLKNSSTLKNLNIMTDIMKRKISVRK